MGRKKVIPFKDLQPGMSYIVQLTKKSDPERMMVVDKLDTTVKTIQGGAVIWRHMEEFNRGDVEVIGAIAKVKRWEYIAGHVSITKRSRVGLDIAYSHPGPF